MAIQISYVMNKWLSVSAFILTNNMDQMAKGCIVYMVCALLTEPLMSTQTFHDYCEDTDSRYTYNPQFKISSKKNVPLVFSPLRPAGCGVVPEKEER